MAEVNRRSLITGLIAFVAAPAIVRAESLMPVKAMVTDAECQAVLNAMYRHWADTYVAVFYGDKVIGIDHSDNLTVRPIRSEMLFRVHDQTDTLFISHKDS